MRAYIACDSCGKETFCKEMQNYVIEETEYLCKKCVDTLTDKEKEEYEDNNT